MNSYQLTAYITALADMIAMQYSTDDLGMIALIFAQLGDTLATIAGYEEYRQNSEN